MAARPLPPKVEAIYREAREGPLSPPHALKTLVHAHLTRAAAENETTTRVDTHLVRHIGDACLAMLDRWPTSDEATKREIQAACLYFADADDGADDFASIGGFEDDAMVINHVARKIGRLDLLIPLGVPRG